LAETICTELKAGQFDLLESQYRDFADRVHQIQPDGTPKNWIYFWSFELGAAKTKSLEAAQVFTQKIRDWLGGRPNSVPATLALENALLGECDCLHTLAEAQHLDMKDPELNQQVQARVDEITSRMKAVPVEELPKLMSEPQYYAVVMHLYILEGVDYDRVQALMHAAQDCDPYYVPFYTLAISFLSNRRVHDSSLPRPEIWLTDLFKPTPLDSDEEVRRKTETYARTISALAPEVTHLDIGLIDWPLLKTGLKDLVQDYGPETNWATRLLSDSWATKDKEAAREALSEIQGSYSPEIIIHPDAFQAIAKWAEEN